MFSWVDKCICSQLAVCSWQLGKDRVKYSLRGSTGPCADVDSMQVMNNLIAKVAGLEAKVKKQVCLAVGAAELAIALRSNISCLLTNTALLKVVTGLVRHYKTRQHGLVSSRKQDSLASRSAMCCSIVSFWLPATA